ncbi:hypothetical protein, partial [Pseudomonas aeruginosa]|uniref:hypothetical protein n=1 Tax=Pseudomonas aeruginosa TaxID=287 RepID=UPI0013DFE967
SASWKNSAGGIGVFHQIREVFFRPSLGFKRIAWTIHLLKMNARYLELCAGNPGIDFSKVLEATKEIGDKTGFFYRWRNRTIFLAFACHIGVKLASTYPIF